MNPEDITATQYARAANIWNTNFQKFPMFKLILRLLSIIKEERQQEGDVVPFSRIDAVSGTTYSAGSSEQPGSERLYQSNSYSSQLYTTATAKESVNQPKGVNVKVESKNQPPSLSQSTTKGSESQTQFLQQSSSQLPSPLQQPKVFKSDTLGFLQEQITKNVQSLAEQAPTVAALQREGSFYLRQ